MSTTSPLPHPTRLVRLPAAAIAAIDVVCVVAFAAIGRGNHGESLGLAAILGVAAPFLVGLAAAWAVTYASKHAAPRSIRQGVLVWIVTLAGGMSVRSMSGGGTAFAFVIVSAIFLSLTLIGWRAIAARRSA
ncbi:DUF3054 domain-containing protein [Dermatophilus congolensis]|uniref:Protein of uncharacterized function (DUF3054) n=1 Tax=Dermatophilus congolensis TaxID=1863 RepID=A0A239VLS6_9MICO|nr:DUF3054 domain-containing protein [Dermatophilus congolensis]MBO3129422.1 DUF3054 domain-containing protein [Dermatophilus congolensis]MBO3131945.1 DUF3054 domain-containing protein [Dermatophilus congolensis]MBO3133899.1 DUF3054 domain-containing protein [Dermatophilus congolensis]MBO3136129.1 DUF3054 domain-containing protein [Dermatophilus congolensis]MBO3138373.1 DUF3054 domain-containing protein [Dermatophilus congolensis]